MAMSGFPCVEEYNPVCGFDYRREQIIYDNDCTACSSEDVVYFIDGECQGRNLRTWF